MEILYFFLRHFLEKLQKNCGEKYAIMDIDTREKYRYLSIPESIDKYRYFNHHQQRANLKLFKDRQTFVQQCTKQNENSQLHNANLSYKIVK